MARKKEQNPADTLVIDLTKLETSKTCHYCKHWLNKQSIFDFQGKKGICLKAPENTSIGYHFQNRKEYIAEGIDKGKPAFYTFCDKPTDRTQYFISRADFGCIKFELLTSKK